MSIIKKFKEFFRKSKLTFDLATCEWEYIDTEELNNICQELIDFGFNSNTGKVSILFSDLLDSSIRKILVALAGKDKLFPIPIHKDKILFKLEFNAYDRSVLSGKENFLNFLDTLEEMIDRIESEFKVELYDENVQSNRIVKQNGEIFLKTNPGDSYDYLSTINLSQNYNNLLNPRHLPMREIRLEDTYKNNQMVPNQFILSFKLKNEPTQ